MSATVSLRVMTAPGRCRRPGRRTGWTASGIPAGLLDDHAVREVAVTGHGRGAFTRSISLRRVSCPREIDNAAFSARRPHMPSMPEHCCTKVIFVPVSFMRSRLLRPMFWAPEVARRVVGDRRGNVAAEVRCRGRCRRLCSTSSGTRTWSYACDATKRESGPPT